MDIDVCIIVVDDHDFATICQLLCLDLVLVLDNVIK
tara:strand:+ start:477 stop:584 length:108 start_codon:yes stop_codon:yes gene_type:complete